MSIELKQTEGVIDFILPKDEVEQIRRNTYLHCNFKDLCIVGNYTPVNYEGVN